MADLKATTVAYSIQNGGDGSAYPSWFMDYSEAEHDQDNLDEGWGEVCAGIVQTYEGSDIHMKALAGSAEKKIVAALSSFAEPNEIWVHNNTITVFGCTSTEKLSEIQDILDLKFPGYKVTGL